MPVMESRYRGSPEFDLWQTGRVRLCNPQAGRSEGDTVRPRGRHRGLHR